MGTVKATKKEPVNGLSTRGDSPSRPRTKQVPGASVITTAGKRSGDSGALAIMVPVAEELILDSKDLLWVLTEVRNGNFSVRMPIDQVGCGERYVIRSTRSFR